jgi:hypothetical protein
VTVAVFFAGVQKAGTSSLYAYCCEHSELAAPPHKEPHFFDDENIDWDRPSYDALHSLYSPAAKTALLFDSTPIYTFWPPSPERIARYNPEARFILLFRDPIERAWSHWRKEYTRGMESLHFAEAIRQGRRRIDEGSATSDAARLFSYVERGFYAAQLERLFGLFPTENVLCLRSRDLLNDPSTVLSTISQFLRIAPFPDTAPRRENPGRPIDSDGPSPADVRYLRRLFRSDVIEFARMSRLDVSDWLTIRE